MIIEGIKFNSDGLIPAIAQDAVTNEVLMMAYMNEEALKKTIETGKAYYFSRSRNKLWLKGESSGHFQEVVEMSLDCDKDALLLKIKQVGGACHTGANSCFFNKIDGKCGITDNGEKVFEPDEVYNNASVLKEVYDVVADRLNNPKEGSYTNYLFEKGIDKILKKVGEETSEVIIAAKNRSADELTYEVADLIYHLTVMMVEQGIKWSDIFGELKKRR